MDKLSGGSTGNNSGGGGYTSTIMGIISFGYWIYTLLNPKKAEKPKPQELQVNNFSRNLPVPLDYGTNKYSGTVMCIGEAKAEEIGSAGGKGGMAANAQQIEGYNYFADFCVGLSEGEIEAVVELFYNDDPFSTVEDLSSSIYWRIYYGLANQEIDPDIYGFFGKKSIPFKNTGYIFLSGCIGSVNTLPSIGGEISGLLSYAGHDIAAPFTMWGWSHICAESAGVFQTYHVYNGISYWFAFNYTTSYLTISRIEEYDTVATIIISSIDGNHIEYTTSSGVLPSSGYLFPTKYDQGDRLFSFVKNVGEDSLEATFNCNTRTITLSVGDELECRIANAETTQNIQYYGDTPDQYYPPGTQLPWSIKTNWAAYNNHIYAIQFYNGGCIVDYGKYYHARFFSVNLDTGEISFNDLTATSCIYDRANLFIWSAYQLATINIDSTGNIWYVNSYGYWHGGFIGARYIQNCGFSSIPPMEITGPGVGYGVVPVSKHFKNHKMYKLMLPSLSYHLYRFTGFGSTIFVADNFPYGFPEDGYLLDGVLYTVHKITNSASGVGVRICKVVGNEWEVIATCVAEDYEGFDLKNYTVSMSNVGMDYMEDCFYATCEIGFNVIHGGVLTFQVSLRKDNVTQIVMDYNWVSGSPTISIDVDSILDLTTGVPIVVSQKVKFFYGFDHRYVLQINILPGTGHDANPIEVLYDFLTNTRYGCGIATTMFDGDPYTDDSGTWRTEYLFCQESIETDIETFESRFLYSNVFLNRMKAFDIIQDILQTCRGFLYFCDGKIKVKIQKSTEEAVLYFGLDNHTFNSISSNSATIIYADFSNYVIGYWNGDIGECTISGDLKVVFVVINQTLTYIEVEVQDSESPTEQTFTVFPNDSFSFILTKDNIKENSFQYKEKEIRETHNRTRLEYINRTDSYRTDTIEYDNNQNIDYTGEIRVIDFGMPGIKRNTQARRMCLFLSDYDSEVVWGCSFQTDILGMFLCLGSIVGITYVGLNWVGKLFRVINMEEMEDFEVKVDLIEYIPSVFHDYAVPVQVINTSDLSDKYAVPDHVERLFLFEARDNNYIYVLFKRPDPAINPFWSGADIYYKVESTGTYVYLGRSVRYASSVKLDVALNSTDTTIYYDPTTMEGAFTPTGSFYINEEEVYYGGIDVINDCFTDCVRGYNDTTASSHLVDSYCHLTRTDFFKYTYKYEDIGKTLYFKAISVTSYNVYADSSTAPVEYIILTGYFMLSALFPYPVQNLAVILI